MKKRALVISTFLVIFLICYGCNKSGEKNIAKIKGWEKAERAWSVFAEHYLKKVHEEESKTPAYKYDPKGFWTVFEEIKSPLINKFFPNHRIFREQLAGAQVLGAFALGKDGTITDIDDGWSGESPTKKFTNPKYSDFLKSQNIKINNASDVAQLIQLTELIDIECVA